MGQLEALGGTNRAGRGRNWAVIGMWLTGINGALAAMIRRRVEGGLGVQRRYSVEAAMDWIRAKAMTSAACVGRAGRAWDYQMAGAGEARFALGPTQATGARRRGCLSGAVLALSLIHI